MRQIYDSHTSSNLQLNFYSCSFTHVRISAHLLDYRHSRQECRGWTYPGSSLVSYPSTTMRSRLVHGKLRKLCGPLLKRIKWLGYVVYLTWLLSNHLNSVLWWKKMRLTMFHLTVNTWVGLGGGETDKQVTWANHPCIRIDTHWVYISIWLLGVGCLKGIQIRFSNNQSLCAV